MERYRHWPRVFTLSLAALGNRLGARTLIFRIMASQEGDFTPGHAGRIRRECGGASFAQCLSSPLRRGGPRAGSAECSEDPQEWKEQSKEEQPAVPVAKRGNSEPEEH